MVLFTSGIRGGVVIGSATKVVIRCYVSDAIHIKNLG